MSLAILCSFFLSACGAEGLANTSDQEIYSHTATETIVSEEPAWSFTAELLPDGLVLLNWPRDPSAISYLVMVKSKLIARLPASELSAVVKIKRRLASINRYKIYSVNASDVRSEWASSPVIIQPEAIPDVTVPVEEPAPIEETPPVVEPAPIEVAPPVVEPAPIEVAPPAVEPAPIEVAPPVVEPAPIEVAPPVVEPAPIVEAPPVVEPAPIEVAPPVEEHVHIEEAPPVEEPAPIEETPPVEEPAPIVEAPPVVEPAPVEELPPIELVNLAPDITNTSYNCDPVVESVNFTVGQTDYFTLSVTDESTLTLTYSVDSSNQGIVNVEVDEDGIFTLSALQAGETYLWLSAEDNMGLVGEYELRIVVQ